MRGFRHQIQENLFINHSFFRKIQMLSSKGRKPVKNRICKDSNIARDTGWETSELFIKKHGCLHLKVPMFVNESSDVFF